MTNHPPLENIEAMRRREGIEDVDLQEEIRGLHPGDVVRVTFLTGGSSFETVPVRVLAIRNGLFRGELTGRTRCGAESLPAGAPLVFTAAHIHSVPRAAPPAVR
jgi:hypothetical protein